LIYRTFLFLLRGLKSLSCIMYSYCFPSEFYIIGLKIILRLLLQLNIALFFYKMSWFYYHVACVTFYILNLGSILCSWILCVLRYFRKIYVATYLLYWIYKTKIVFKRKEFESSNFFLNLLNYILYLHYNNCSY